MKTSIVILNYNTAGYLSRFLPPLLDSIKGLDAEVVVADNASTDSSLEVMSSEFPSIRVIALDKNYGFTGGYNRALKEIDADLYVLLNTDVEVPSGWLEPLVGHMDSHPECGACGPKLLSYSDRERFEYAGAAGGFIDRYGYPFCRGRLLSMTEKDEGQYDAPLDVHWVSGACLMVRSEVFHGLGGFDEDFFAHFDEIDLCWRMQLAGWKVTAVPSSAVYHIGGGTLPQTSPFKLRLNYRNSLLTLWKNLPATVGPAKARRRLVARMLLDGVAALVYLLKGQWSSFPAVWTAHKEFRQMRGAAPPSKGCQVEGLYPGCILIDRIFRKNRIFAFCRKKNI